MTVSGWVGVQARLTKEQMDMVVEEAARPLSRLPFSVIRNRTETTQRAHQEVQNAFRRLALPSAPPTDIQTIVAQVVARVSGLGFLDALLPPNSDGLTDIAVNPDGSVWVRHKGKMHFEKLDRSPSKEEVVRAVDSLLGPTGRHCSEATPSVDARLPRDMSLAFGGARVKVIHPAIASGDGYPTLALRLFEPKPVSPEQIVGWGVMPQTVMEAILELVAKRLRFVVVGGTSTGKTTLLSALCHAIPRDARIVKVEDPEEIYLPHPNVVTLEARPVPPGSDVPPYTVADGVDDALRLAPSHLIVGEARDGRAALSLFRALMTDHAGGTTFHAEGAEEAVFRLALVMFADAQVRFEPAKMLFYQALDLVIQLGWVKGVRACLGIWEVADLKSGEVQFRELWKPGTEKMEKPRRRGV